MVLVLVVLEPTVLVLVVAWSRWVQLLVLVHSRWSGAVVAGAERFWCWWYGADGSGAGGTEVPGHFHLVDLHWPVSWPIQTIRLPEISGNACSVLSGDLPLLPALDIVEIDIAVSIQLSVQTM